LKKEIKVLHIIPNLGQGGAERQLVELISDNKSHQICQLLPINKYDFNTHLEKGSINTLNMKRKMPDIRVFYNLYNVINTFKPQIIHTWMYHSCLLESLLRKITNKKNILLVWGLRCSNMEVKHYSVQLKLIIRACKYFSYKPNIIIHNSFSGKKFHDKLGFNNKGIVVPNGIDTKRFFPNEKYRANFRLRHKISKNTKIVLCAARKDPMKDHQTLINSFNNVRNKFSDVILVLAGKETEKMPKVDNLIALGAYRNMEEVYSAADIIICSSAFGEGFSNALGEGMSSELIPISTDVGDAKYIIGDTGVIVPPNHVEAMSRAILETLNLSNNEFLSRKKDARKRIKLNFSKNKMLSSYALIYFNLLNSIDK
jgi:glycosyltransferase involved in cell wall biosynthesis